MRNFLIIMIGLIALFVGTGLFLGYVLGVGSSLKPKKQVELHPASELLKEQTKKMQETKKKREQLMEEYKFKLDLYKGSQKF